MKHRVISRIISCFLCTALTMQVGLALMVERVNAAGSVSSTESEDGSIVTIYSMPREPETYEFSAEDGGITITYYNIENADIYTKHFDKIAVLNIDGMSEARIKSDITIGQIVVEETGEIQIEDNCKLSCSEIVSKDDMNLLIRHGSTLECGSITAEEDGYNQINSYGYIICDSLDFSDVSYWGSDDSTITVTSSFINGSYNVEGKVIAERSTYISTAGGSFTLQVGGATKEITGNVSGYANEFVDDPEISLVLNSDNSTVYYGTDYDFSKYVSVTEGYDKSLVTFEYSSDGGLTVLDEKPTYPLNGNYYVRAVAPADGAFIESKSEWKSYKIQYLPIEALEEFYEEGEPYVTVTGVIDRGEDEKYVSEGITLTAPEGVLIQFPYAGREALHTPAQSVTLTHDDLFLEGYTTINQDFEIQFVRDGDLATTQTKSILDVVDGIDTFVFDNYDPQITAELVLEGSEVSREISMDGSVVKGKGIDFNISDENLSEVILSVNGNENDLSENITASGECEFRVDCASGVVKRIQITATDRSGRVTQSQITLANIPDYIDITDGSSGKIVSFTPSEDENLQVYLLPGTDENGYEVSCNCMSSGSDDSSEFSITIDNIERFELYGTTTLRISEAEIESEIYFDNFGTNLYVSSDGILTCKGLSGFGTIWNTATIVFSDFDSSEYSSEDCAIQIYNLDPGKIIADNIDISTTSCEIDGEEITTVDQVEGSVYKATTSFTKGDGDLPATVVAEENTVINSGGGSFTLQVGDITKKITGKVTNKTAKDLLKEYENYGSIIVDGNTVELTTTGKDTQTVTFTITKDSDGYKIECDRPDLLGDGETQTVGSLDKLSVNGGYCEVSIKADMEIELDLNGEWITVDIDNNAAVTCSDLIITSTLFDTPNIVINVDGELIMTDFILSDYPYTVQFYNSGEIYADTVEISADSAYSHLENNTSVIVESSFTLSTNVLSIGFIVAGNEDTLIRSEGYFTLKYGDLTKEISGDVGPIEAIKLFDDPGITLDEIPDVDFGTNYNFSSYVHTATGYSGTPVLQYSSDGENYDSDKPVASGDYYIRAYAPAAGSYREAYSEAQEFSITSVANRGNIIVNGSAVTLQTIGDANTVTFTITKESSGYTIECDHPDTYDGGTVEIAGNIDKLTIDGYNINIIVKGDNNIITDDLVLEEIVFSAHGFTFTIENDATVKFLNRISSDENASGKVIINGTLFWNNFNTGNWSNITFENYGQIYADTVDITYTGNLVCDSDSIIAVTSSFTMGTEDFEGTVIADNSYTKIVSAGGKFFLYLTGASDTFEGEINSTAGELLLDPIEIGFYIDDEPIITGESYDFIYYVYTNPSGYETYVRFEYAPYNSDEFTNTKPTAAGYYKVRAILDGSSEWLDSMSADHYYFIQDMALSDLFPDGNYHVTLDGYYNNYYIPEALVLKAPEGVMIGCPALLDGYYDSFSLTYEALEEKGLITDGHIDKDLVITFAKIIDDDPSGETSLATAGGTTIDKVFLDIESYTFDSYDPGFDAMIVDSEGGLVETSVDGDTDKVFADELRITVSDEFLSSVTLSVDGTETDLSDTIEEGGICEITLNATEGKAQEIKITAKDLAERTAVAEFTLYHEPVDPSLTVTLPDTIYYGDEINPVISIDENYDGEISVKYLYPGEDLATEAAPTNAGTYVLSVYAEATDLFTEASYEEEFDILKKDIDPESLSVEVEDIKVGQTPAPSVTGLPDDFDGEIIFFYINGEGESCSVDSLAAGNYLVRANISNTNDYVGTSCETDLEVSKYDIAEAEVTVASIKVGQIPEPALKGIPEDYDGEITYAYIDGEGDDCEADSLAAGSYLVRVTIPETYKYDSKICETDLEVSKYDINDAEVTVENIKVGQVPSPVVTGLPDDYDGDITYTYIDEDGDECAAESLAAGTYAVFASISDTDTYVGMTCETELEVSKSDIIDAEVTVEDIKFGQTPAPVVTGIPEDYDGEITYAYINGEGDDCAADSLAAGSYLVRVTIPDTDKYEGTTCEADLEVSKYDIAEAEVTVASIKVGQIPEPVLKGIPEDYDGEITIEYLGGNGENGSADSLAAGSYLVRVTIPETDKYEKKVLETDLVVSKNDITEAKVTVENIFVGQTPAPVVTGLPEDYDGTVTFEYIDGNGEDCSADSLAAGGYHVIASIPETDKYERITCETDLVVSKYDVDASVTAADILVGGKVDPVITIDPEDYDGEITIEYKGDADQGYSTTVPTAAGSYSVRVTLPETDKFLGTTCEDRFTISKNEATAEVSVADIYVGGTVKPVVTTASNGKVTFEYKLSSAPDSAYTTTVPTAAGEYTVRATIASTDEYLGTTCEGTFKILKLEATVKVLATSIYVGNEPELSISTNSNGARTIEYKLKNDPDTAYSKTVPVAAGEYTVRVTIAETDKYLGTSGTADFKISKMTATAKVSVADIYVGETPAPLITTNSDGAATFEYKLITNPDTAYTKTVPEAAGHYKVRVTIAETDKYLGTTCEADFYILKRTPTATVAVEDITVGGTVKPVVTTDSDGKATFMYKLSTDPDSAYKETVPSVAGVYSVRATIAETDKYKGTTCTGTFTISKNVTTATVSVADIYVGGKVTPVVTTISNGKDGTTFEYKLSAESDEAYSGTVPSAAGTYMVRATVPATVEYARIVCTAEFKIMLNPVTKMVLTVPDIYYGQTVKPSFETDSDGKVTIMYKSSGADDSEYTDKAPAAVGKYTAIAIVDATDYYASASVTVEFSISYLENPQIVYVPSGTPGNNGYYTSDVDLKAPEGYLISATPDGEFTDKIPYTEDLGVIYLKRIEDNALTAAIVLSDKPKIDKIAPVINDTAGGLLEDAILFEESLVVVVDDKNLTSLTVNGDVVALNANGATMLTLTRPEDGYMKYHIVAVDVAGNTSTLDITLMADWLKEKIIPAGRALPLTTGEMYYLDVGEWIVTIVNSDGTETESKTVFSGNMPFYVSSDAQYIFKKVT